MLMSMISSERVCVCVCSVSAVCVYPEGVGLRMQILVTVLSIGDFFTIVLFPRVIPFTCLYVPCPEGCRMLSKYSVYYESGINLGRYIYFVGMKFGV